MGKSNVLIKEMILVSLFNEGKYIADTWPLVQSQGKKTDDSFYTHYTNFIPATPQPINLEKNKLNSIFF